MNRSGVGLGAAVAAGLHARMGFDAAGVVTDDGHGGGDASKGSSTGSVDTADSATATEGPNNNGHAVSLSAGASFSFVVTEKGDLFQFGICNEDVQNHQGSCACLSCKSE